MVFILDAEISSFSHKFRCNIMVAKQIRLCIVLHLYCHTSPDKAVTSKFQPNTKNDRLTLLQAPTFGNWLGLTEWTSALCLIGQMGFFTFHFTMRTALEIVYHSFLKYCPTLLWPLYAPTYIKYFYFPL